MNATYDTKPVEAQATSRVHVRPESGQSAPVCWSGRAAAEGYAARMDQLRGERRWAYSACDCPNSGVQR